MTKRYCIIRPFNSQKIVLRPLRLHVYTSRRDHAILEYLDQSIMQDRKKSHLRKKRQSFFIPPCNMFMFLVLL
jgi:hypothetical protein